MAKRIFFSFHFQNDVWRAGQVRNIGVVSNNFSPFVDSAEWEKIKQKGEKAITNWIDEQLQGTSTTIILAGTETYGRKYINYEIEKSFELGKKILVINIHNIKDRNGNTSKEGKNPLSYFRFNDKPLSSFFDYYNPSSADSYNDIAKNIETWISKAKSKSDIT